jgi:hypothetical protein
MEAVTVFEVVFFNRFDLVFDAQLFNYPNGIMAVFRVLGTRGPGGEKSKEKSAKSEVFHLQSPENGGGFENLRKSKHNRLPSTIFFLCTRIFAVQQLQQHYCVVNQHDKVGRKKGGSLQRVHLTIGLKVGIEPHKESGKLQQTASHVKKTQVGFVLGGQCEQGDEQECAQEPIEEVRCAEQARLIQQPQGPQYGIVH